MKENYFFLLGVVLIFCACNKGSENSVSNRNALPGELSAKIDGVMWNADSSKSAIIMNGAIGISGVSLDTKTIAIKLNDAGAGKYVLNRQAPNVAIYYNDSTYVQFFTTAPNDPSAKEGVIDITALDETNHTITGSFQFNVYNDSCSCQRSITEGVFNKLPYITSLPFAKSTDTFYTKIDGVIWNAKSIFTNIIAGKFVIKGSEPDDSKSVELLMNRYLVPLGLDSLLNIIVPPPPYEYSFDGFFYQGKYHENFNALFEDNGNGQVTILEFDPSKKRIRGYFSFDAYSSTANRSVIISEGYFSVGY